MRLSEVLNSVRHDGEEWIAAVTDDWLQGRSLFGGIQVAVCWQAMRNVVPLEMRLRTITVSFIAPVVPGTLRLQTRILRESKNTVQVEARLLDGDATACLLLAVFGQARESVVQVTPQPLPFEPSRPPFEMRYVPDITPAFMQHFKASWLDGALPFSGGRATRQVIDVSLSDEGIADEGQLLAFADFIPPIGLSWFDQPKPGSSLTWMLETFADCRGLPLQNWRIDAQLQAAADGYTSQQLMLWGPNGEPLALSRQSMVVFG